jgi:Bacteriocin-protection, YdeI or OmpD-Associated/Domain of unknown function (DUF1905)
MHHFRTTLVSGMKRPYKSWTFVVIPTRLATDWGPGQKAVRVSVAGYTLLGTASRGEGVMRVPLPRDFREMARLSCGDTVEIALEADLAPRRAHVPAELQAVLSSDPEIRGLYGELPPSMRRAWATYVAEAKHSETRVRRASRAADGIRARSYP